MWGYKKSEDKKLALNIFKTILKQTYGHEWNNDQKFLKDFVLEHALKSSITHDAYIECGKQGIEPWPSKRIGKCFVGSRSADCDDKTTKPILPCPEECRPKEHKDWLYC